MTWAIVMLILMSLVKIVLTCLPTGVIEWLLSKFEVHAKVNNEDAVLSVNGKRLEGEEKRNMIDQFNEAVFLEKYYIYPGDEERYLYPENGGTPLVIDTKKGKKDVKLFVYSYDDHIDVVKQYKKKVIAYRLLSESMQKQSLSVTGSLA
ncbi:MULTISPECIES: YfmQ family protein [Bacillus]|uniref:YfmQ n=1 Tax=Bacillus mojavensis TaxID=72360 RepID=A0ABX6LTU9_BACMO|nr:YfmQ family protein [Bacillus mojavensis]MCY8104738.1 YfmQ family protein [Bacillus mojavensis]MCY8481996.1 YfmQ family protein [Bacillus mojavensis]MCY9187517.1 YfmQ family protein [Bacillus mojavensis]MEC1679486.1 YfmQ family protein [Bacillus mojavensis]MEC1688607.1 YfmQ family protein [Bacillus mojavensis]